jgi:aspartyl-tRNA(Asn)/glutamyl-tRNA(Gln) amidotransferase subunit A
MTVRDAAVMLDVMSGFHWGDGYSFPSPNAKFTKSLGAGVKGLKIAWSPDLGYATVDTEVKQICERAAKEFSTMGATFCYSVSHNNSLRPSSPSLRADC